VELDLVQLVPGAVIDVGDLGPVTVDVLTIVE